MEAQKPNVATKPAKVADNKKSNVPGIKNAIWVIIACAVVAVCLFIFWFGADMHFDEDGHPQNIWGTIYKGGFIVPVLQTLFLTVIVLSVERWIALSSAKGKGNTAKFVAAVKNCLAKNDIAGAQALCTKQKGSVAAVVAAAQSIHAGQGEHTLCGVVVVCKEGEQIRLVGQSRRQQRVHHLTGSAAAGSVRGIAGQHGGFPGLAVVVLHLGEAVALGVPGVGGLEVLLAAQVVLVQLDELVPGVVAVNSSLVVGVFLVDDIPVGVELEPGEAAVQIRQFHHLIFRVIPVIRLGPVGILDGDGVAHIVIDIVDIPVVVVIDIEQAVQKVVLKGGLAHPVHHTDQIAGAVVEIGGGLAVGVAGLAHQIDGAVFILGDIPVLVGFLDEIAVAVVDQRLTVSGGVDLGLHQATVVIGVQGLLDLVHLMNLVDAPQRHLGKPVHLVILEEAAVALAVDGFDDIPVAVQFVTGANAVAVGDANDAAILIIVESLGPVKGVGLADDAV